MKAINSRITINIIRISCAAIGIFFAGLALYSHYAILSGEGKIFCDVSAVVNCSRVIGSGYGTLFGIPLGFFGISFWFAVLALSAAQLFFDIDEKLMNLAQLVYGGFGLVAALVLAIISTMVIRSLCHICLTTQLLCLAYCVASLLAFMKLKDRPLAAIPKIFINAVLVSVAAGIIPLAAGSIYVSAKKGEALPVSSAKIHDFEQDVIFQKTGFHSLGKDTAPVKITVFTDFECFWCKKFHKQIFSAMQKVGTEKIQLIFRNFPLKNHAHALDAALAARCAGRQGKFWEYADWAYAAPDDQKMIDAMLSREGLAGKARGMGLDEKQFARCFDNREELPAIEKDKADAESLGLKGTPFLLLNGKPYTSPWTNMDIFVKDLRIAAGLEKRVSKLIEYTNPTLNKFLPGFVMRFIDRVFGIVDVSYQDVYKTGRNDYIALSLKDYGIMFMILSDTDQDGIIDDFTWVLGSQSSPESSAILYSESTRSDSPSRIWYGPGNIKILAREDLNKDGVFETVVYYNETAVSKSSGGIVARFETDMDGDGRPDTWTYPGRRMEIDANGDGRPDLYSEDKTVLTKNYDVLVKSMKKDALQGLPLAEANSWALNPNLITEKQYQAIIPKTYPVIKQ